MELSKRLTAVAGLVTEGASVADIGTDHGYIPIHLIEQNLSPKVIAMDINKGPLERARIHIAGYGMSDRIETRLSDGLAAVKPKEVEEMIVAGMGDTESTGISCRTWVSVRSRRYGRGRREILSYDAGGTTRIL